MAYSSLYPMLLSLLLLSLSNTLLCSVHRNPKLPQAPSPALVVAATPPAPAPVEAPAPAPVEETPSPSPSPSPSSSPSPSPVSALAPAEAPTIDVCPDVNKSGLLDCMDYLAGTDTKPSPSCCSDLREIAKQNVACLCSILTSKSDDFVDTGFQMNTSRVLSLPYTCTFPLPSSSKCTALLAPPTVAAVPGPSASQGTSDIPSPPESLAAAFPVTIFTIAAGIAVSTLSLFA